MAMRPGRIALDLIDQNGEAFGIADLAGRPSLVYFGFLHCRAVCPRSLARLAAVLDELGPDRNQVRILYISVDPERDTPVAMKSFLDAQYPTFIGLTGSTQAIETAKASMNVFTRRAADLEDPGGYAVPHTALIYLVDANGDYVTHFADHLDAGEISSQVKAVLSPTGRR